LLGELERDHRFVVADLEAGVGTLLRLQPGQADVVLAVADPTSKAVEVARRALEIAGERARVIVIANRVRGESDLRAIRDALGAPEVVAVPEDGAITAAERNGAAPIDLAADAPAVAAIEALAAQIAGLQ
jgi:CO dehydrogenase nickel-insertion accessory protein CooC1